MKWIEFLIAEICGWGSSHLSQKHPCVGIVGLSPNRLREGEDFQSKNGNPQRVR